MIVYVPCLFCLSSNMAVFIYAIAVYSISLTISMPDPPEGKRYGEDGITMNATKVL